MNKIENSVDILLSSELEKYEPIIEKYYKDMITYGEGLIDVSFLESEDE